MRINLPKVCLISVATVFVFLSNILADDASIERDAKSINYSVMSPFCPGRLLEDCPSSQAMELREKILQDLRAGKSRAEVEDSIYALYGEAIRGAPTSEGFGVAAWIATPIFFIIGVIVSALLLRKLKIKES